MKSLGLSNFVKPNQNKFIIEAENLNQFIEINEFISYTLPRFTNKRHLETI